MTISRRQIDNIFVVQIERPEHRNAVDAATARQLADAFREFDADPRSDVAILTGAAAEVTAGSGENRNVAARVRIELAKRCGELQRRGRVDGVAVLRPLDLHHEDVVDLTARDCHDTYAQLVFGRASGRGTDNGCLSTEPA